MNFCVGICESDKCRLFEVPLCPDHGVFYCLDTTSSPVTTGTCPFQGCLKCVPPPWPCSECGAAMALQSIGLDLDEAAYLRSVYKASPEKLKHTLLRCGTCGIAGFPGSRGELTVRTDDAAFKSTRRGALAQESWVGYTIHHPSCTTTALVNVPIFLTRATIVSIIQAHSLTLDAWMEAHPAARLNEFMVVQKAARVKRSPAGGVTSLTKAVGLRLLSKMVQRLRVGEPLRSAALLGQLNAALKSTPPAALFSEWSSTPSTRDEACVLLDPVASAEVGDARKALASVVGSWSTSASSLLSWWSVGVAPKESTLAPGSPATAFQVLPLSRVQVCWEVSGTDAKLLPRRFVLETSVAGGPWTVVHAPRVASNREDIILEPPVPCTHIRILMKGFADGNNPRRHGIASVACWAAPEGVAAPVPSGTMQDLASILSLGKRSVGSDLTGLVSLARASASLSQLLTLSRDLLDLGNQTFDFAAEEVVSLIQAIQDAAVSEQKRQVAVECIHPASTGAAQSSDLSRVPAEFDTDKSFLPSGSGVVELKESNTVASSSSGSHAVVLVNRAITSGKANWEIRLEEDTSSQCTCFGVAVRPIRDCNYEKSKEMWLYRAYNGYKYSQGVCNSTTGTKVNKGDTVRCELDLEAGTLNLLINGTLATTFTGLQGQELYPAVQFYSSGRTVRLLSMEVSGVTAASVVTVTTPVASLDESSSFVGYGSLGKLGDLGFTFAASRKVSVNSLALAQSISMHPPVNHDGKSYAFAKYAVNKKFERLSGSVALNDATPADKLRAQGSAVTFSVIGDGRQLWESKPMLGPGIVEAYDLDILQLEELELRVRCEDKNKYCHAVWVDPTLKDCLEWSCSGWRNDKDTFVCAVSGVARGSLPPLGINPPPCLPASGVALATSLLESLACLALQTSRGMKQPLAVGQSGEAATDLAEPFCIEATPEVFSALSTLFQLVLKSIPTVGSAEEQLCVSVLSLIRANLRRLISSQIGIDNVWPECRPFFESLRELLRNPTSLSDGTRCVCEDIVSSSVKVFFPTLLARLAWYKQAIPGAGVLEFQIDFPSPTLDSSDGEPTSLDTLFLRLQLLCRNRGWRCTVLGRWPAKLYLVMEVPLVSLSGALRERELGLLGFLSADFGAVLESCGLTGWDPVDGISTPFVPIKLERFPVFNRSERLLLEPGSVIRLHPDTDGTTFDTVLTGLRSFLPARL